MKTFRPQIEQLETRDVPAVVSYTGYAVTLIGTGTVTEDFSWDETGMSYSMALSSLSSTDAANSALASMADSAYGTIDQDGCASDVWVTGLEGAIDSAYTANSQFFGGIREAAGVIFDGYYDPTPGVTIDASVTNVATAKARMQTLLSNARTITARDKVILDDINSSGTIVSVAKSIGYSSEVKTNSSNLKAIAAELKLIKAAYPAVFK